MVAFLNEKNNGMQFPFIFKKLNKCMKDVDMQAKNFILK